MAGAQGTSADYSAPPSPPRGSGAPAEGLPPHTPGRCSASFPHRPAKIVLTLCGRHTRTQACHVLLCPPPPTRAAGTAAGGPAGGEGVCRPWLPRSPGAPYFSRLCVPGCRCFGHSLSRAWAGSGFAENLEGQSLAVLCWMPGPRQSCG